MSKQSVDDLMGGPVATDGNDEPVACRGGVLGGIAALAGLDNLEVQVRAGRRTAAPEATGPPAARCRVDDDQRSQIRRSPASPRISPVSTLPPKRFFR
jgi:hypothetical protein